MDKKVGEKFDTRRIENHAPSAFRKRKGKLHMQDYRDEQRYP